MIVLTNESRQGPDRQRRTVDLDSHVVHRPFCTEHVHFLLTNSRHTCAA